MSKSNSDSSSLSLEQKIGLMIWCPFYGYRRWYQGEEFHRQREMIKSGLIGGVVVEEGELYETATQIQELQQGLALPLVVAAEIENGLGSLLKEGTQFPSNMAFGATRSGEYGYLAGKISAEEAGAVGINMIFGPTCSRPGAGLPDGLPPFRSFGERLHLVTRLSIAFVKGVKDGGGVAVPRYFPGTAAVHSGEISGSKWLHYLRKLLVDTELSIYEMLAQAGHSALMVDWREIPDLLTGKPMPSITNRHLLEVFLREVMGFEGVVISPDLSVKRHPNLLAEETIIAAVNAGVDVLAGVPDPAWVLNILINAVVQEKIPLCRINKAAERLLDLKGKLKNASSFSIRPEEVDKRVANRANLEVADRIAEDSITLLRDRKKLLPLDTGVHRPFLNLAFTAMFDPDKGKPFDETLRKAFDRVITHQLDSQVSPAKLDKAWEAAQMAGIILCAMYTNLPPDYSAHGFSPTQVEFIRKLIERDTPVMMVSFGDPRTIALFPDIDCYICLYSDCQASQAALVRELFGKLVMPVKGKLPVTLDSNLPYGFGLDLNP